MTYKMKISHTKTSIIRKHETLLSSSMNYKMLSYRRDSALQGPLVSAKSGRLELKNDILRTL